MDGLERISRILQEETGEDLKVLAERLDVSRDPKRKYSGEVHVIGTDAWGLNSVRIKMGDIRWNCPKIAENMVNLIITRIRTRSRWAEEFLQAAVDGYGMQLGGLIQEDADAISYLTNCHAFLQRPDYIQDATGLPLAVTVFFGVSHCGIYLSEQWLGRTACYWRGYMFPYVAHPPAKAAADLNTVLCCWNPNRNRPRWTREEAWKIFSISGIKSGEKAQA